MKEKEKNSIEAGEFCIVSDGREKYLGMVIPDFMDNDFIGINIKTGRCKCIAEINFKRFEISVITEYQLTKVTNKN
ncbi:MAG: hypothetical protein LBT24_01525 [Tannerella sp.]|jgi:hypothetical protein|nr:hypothetical protein [Tannerella sp.]